MQCTSVHSISRQSTGWQYARRQNTARLTTYWQPTDWQILTGKVPACILSAGKVHHVQNTTRQYIGRQSTSWQYMGRQSSTCATWLACKLPTTIVSWKNLCNMHVNLVYKPISFAVFLGQVLEHWFKWLFSCWAWLYSKSSNLLKWLRNANCF